MNYAPTPRQRGDNQDAAKAMLSLLGGAAGYFNLPATHRREDFARILHADQSDDLSGLRLLASRMEYDGIPRGPQSQEESQRFLEPQVASWWLQTTRRADIVDGRLELGPKPDHLAIAALAIANSEASADFYDAYAEASDNGAPLSCEVITEIARNMTDSYFASPELETALFEDDTPSS